jgi:hypothetical protein
MLQSTGVRVRVRVRVDCVQQQCHAWKLSEESLEELRWWMINVEKPVPVRIEDMKEQASIYSDASSYGFGSTNGLWGLWSGEEVDWHIAKKEMEAVRRTIGRLNNNSSAKIMTDNVAVHWCLVKGRSHVKDLNELIRRIGADIADRQLDLTFHWVCSEENLADEVSRRTEFRPHS